MNRRQLRIISERLQLPPDRAKAVRAVLLPKNPMSDGAAERFAHGHKTHTVRRDIARIRALYKFYKDLDNAK